MDSSAQLPSVSRHHRSLACDNQRTGSDGLDQTIKQKLNVLGADYEEVAGKPFLYFYCPVLFRDEDVDLCQAHIVNRAFPESGRNWTVQRSDVDNFYGRVFEGDFVDLQYRGRQLPEDVIVDPGLSKKLRPRIQMAGEEVRHFVARGPVPAHFTEAVVTRPGGTVRLGLKIHPVDVAAALNKGCEIVVEKDVRLAALASLLKAAHLTLFEMLGYRYALSAGGQFLGWTVLGEFFLRNRDLTKADILADATCHFREFANMIRPVLATPMGIQGTMTDHFLYVCRCADETPWAFVVFIRTSDLLHAVLVPVLETPNAAERFVTFLRAEGGSLRANRCRFEDDKFWGAKDSELLSWPKAEFL